MPASTSTTEALTVPLTQRNGIKEYFILNCTKGKWINSSNAVHNEKGLMVLRLFLKLVDITVKLRMMGNVQGRYFMCVRFVSHST